MLTLIRNMFFFAKKVRLNYRNSSKYRTHLNFVRKLVPEILSVIIIITLFQHVSDVSCKLVKNRT